MVDAARSHAEGQHDQDSRTDLLTRQGDVIKVRNQSGQDLDRFAVLGIDSAIIPPDANALEFKNQPATNAIVPTDAHAGQFIVLLDPLKNGRIGRAWVSGVCICQVRIDEDWHTFADIEAGKVTSLVSKPDGGAKILWREDGVGLLWAIVRLSNVARTHYLARIPGSGIPGRQGLQTGSATCELFTVDDTGLIERVQRPGGETVNVTVRHHETQPIRGPVDVNEPQYLGVTFDGRDSWLLDPPKQTLLCKPGRRIKAKSSGTARELRFTGGKWSAIGSVVSVYNVCDYALLPSQQIVCHYHEDTSAYLTIGCRCCDGSSSSSSSSGSSSSESSVSSSSSDSSSSSSDSSSASSSSSLSSQSSLSSLSSSDSSLSSSSGSSSASKSVASSLSSSSSSSSSSESSSGSSSSGSSSSGSSSQSSSSESESSSDSSSASSGTSSSGSSHSSSDSSDSSELGSSQSQSSDSESDSGTTSVSSDSASSESASSRSDSSKSESSQSESTSESVSDSESRPSKSYSVPSYSAGSASSSQSGFGSSASESDFGSGSGSASGSASSNSESRSTSQSDSGSDSRSESASNSESEPPPGSSSSSCTSTWLWSCGWELVDSDCPDPQAPSSSGSYDGELLETAG